MLQHKYATAQQEQAPEVIPLKPPDQPKIKPPHRQGLLYDRTVDKFLILLLPLTWFVYYSWRPIYRLRVDMPPEFVDVPATARPAERAKEERLARRYWDLAEIIRWKYTNGSPLPADPPMDFRLDGSPAVAAAAPKAEANTAARQQVKREAAPADSRTRYWHKLQTVWLQPDAWEAQREWSTTWFTEPFVRIYLEFTDYCSDLLRMS